MLEDPALSRQWAARRLQRALGLERWGGALRAGMARRLAPPLGPRLSRHAERAAQRAATLERLLGELDSVPYSAGRVARPLAGAAGMLLATVTARGARGAARRLAEHALGEYETLTALMDGAPGVPAGFVDVLRPMRDEAGRHAAALRTDGADVPERDGR